MTITINMIATTLGTASSMGVLAGRMNELIRKGFTAEASTARIIAPREDFTGSSMTIIPAHATTTIVGGAIKGTSERSGCR